MCTAISFKGEHHLFARTLDHTRDYGERVVTLEREKDLKLGHVTGFRTKYAVIGMAVEKDGVPLFFDAMNECGLVGAGLNLPKSTHLRKPLHDKRNIGSHELLGFILSSAASLREAEELLGRVNLTSLGVIDGIPPAPLHYIFSDKSGSIVFESTSAGCRIYDDPVGVLTNEPELPKQLEALARYKDGAEAGIDLSARIISRDEKDPYYLGAWSSGGRFIRAAMIRDNIPPAESREEAMRDCLSAIMSMAVPNGAVSSGDGFMSTRYISVSDTEALVYRVLRTDTGVFSSHRLIRDPRDAR